MPRPISVTIHPNAIAHNYQRAQALAANAEVWAVLKANAYGHGIEVAGAALLAIADGFAVLELAEAIALRRLGCQQPILLLEGVFSPEDLLVAQAFNLELVVATPRQVDMLRAYTPAAQQPPLKVTIKVNTTMNRLGFNGATAASAWAQLAATPAARPCRWMVHFPNAEREDAAIKMDMANILATLVPLIQQHPAPLSAANSASIMFHPQNHQDMVRAGIMLYGSNPNPTKDYRAWGLQTTMSFNSEVIALQDIKVGEAVGYGSRYVATAPTRIAVVACGYADGYPRQAADGTPVLVDGIECPLVGRVSMDMLTVSVTEHPYVKIGSKVELWGENVSIDRVASSCQSISYALFCAVAARVNRRIAL